MTTREDLLNQGYTNTEIDNALNNIIPASSLIAGMPIREDIIKSNYILASLAGSSNMNLTGGGIQNLYTQNLAQFAYVRADDQIAYTKNGTVWLQPTTNLDLTYDLIDWNTALVVIKSAGGAGVDSNLYSDYHFGESYGNVSVSNITKVLRLWSGPSALISHTTITKGNQGGQGEDFAFLVDVSGLTNITITLGLGGVVSSSSSGQRGGTTKFGDLITIEGGIGGADFVPSEGSTPISKYGSNGVGSAIQFMKIN